MKFRAQGFKITPNGMSRSYKGNCGVARFAAQQKHAAIRSELRSIDCPIPSLHFLWESRWSQLSQCMCWLSKAANEAVMQRNGFWFTGAQVHLTWIRMEQTGGQCIVEPAESDRIIKPDQTLYRLNWGMQQLWIYGTREYLDMPPRPKKKEKDLLFKTQTSSRSLCPSMHAGNEMISHKVLVIAGI